MFISISFHYSPPLDFGVMAAVKESADILCHKPRMMKLASCWLDSFTRDALTHFFTNLFFITLGAKLIT